MTRMMGIQMVMAHLTGDNSYHHNGIPEKFQFCETGGQEYFTWDEFRAFGQEPNGTMDSLVVVPDDTPPQVCPICPGI